MAPARNLSGGGRQYLSERVRGAPEFLDALSGIDLGGIDVAFGIDRHRMDPVKLPGVAAVVSETADDGPILAVQDPDFIVLAIGAQQIGLFRVGPDRDIPHRAVAERALLVEPLFHEAAVLPENLDAIIDAVADIDEPVIGDLHAMHGIAELRRHRRLRIIRRLPVVVWRVAIGAPRRLVGARRGVEHDDAAIAIAVGDIDFVRIPVDGSLGRLAELRGVVAALARGDLADLHHEFAVEGEFQNGVVVVGVSPDPDETLVVDLDTVFAADPFVAFTRSAPAAQQIAVAVELQHRWRRHAAFRARRRQRCPFLVVGQRAWAMDDPDVALRIDCDATDLAEDPVVGQRLWPRRVHREGGDFTGMRGA